MKIFDLGLAKEVDPQKALDDGTYHLTADTGSLRYMVRYRCFSFHRNDLKSENSANFATLLNS